MDKEGVCCGCGKLSSELLERLSFKKDFVWNWGGCNMGTCVAINKGRHFFKSGGFAALMGK